MIKEIKQIKKILDNLYKKPYDSNINNAIIYLESAIIYLERKE